MLTLVWIGDCLQTVYNQQQCQLSFSSRNAV